MNRHTLAFSVATLAAAAALAPSAAHAKRDLTDYLWDRVHALSTGGTLRMGPQHNPDPRIGALRPASFVVGPDVVETSLVMRTRTIIRTNTYRFTARPEKYTMTGTHEICSVIIRTGQRFCTTLPLSATSIEPRGGEQQGWRLELVGETRLDPPDAPLAPAISAGAYREADGFAGLARTTIEASGIEASGIEASSIEASSIEAGADLAGLDLAAGEATVTEGEGHEHGNGAEEAGEPAVNVRVAGPYAYVARYGDGLVVVDTSDLARPRPIGWAPVLRAGEIYNDVKLAPSGPYVLMAGSASGMVSIDVSDPTRPRTAARWPSDRFANVHTLYVEGTTAYLADISLGGIRIVDVANPASPVELGRFIITDPTMPGFYFTHDLMVRDGIAYLSSWDAGLVIVDCRNPARPVELGRYNYPGATSHSVWVSEMDGRLIAVHGDEGYGAHLRVLDVTDPASITLLGEWETRPEVSIHNLSIDDGKAYMAHYQDGVRIVDLRKPAMPKEIAYFNTWTFGPAAGYSLFEGAVGTDVDPSRDLIFVADTHRGLLILHERRELP